MSKDQIIIKADSTSHTIEVNGKKYKAIRYVSSKKLHNDRVVYQPIDNIAYEQRLDRLAADLVNRAKTLTVCDILKEALRIKPVSDLARLEKKLSDANNKVKVSRGCLSIDIGDKDCVQII
jgi:hypothetical protein